MVIAILAWALLGGEPTKLVERGGQPREQRGPAAKIDFVLRDVTGRPFHFRRETDGVVTLLFFGYTSCPDVCPVTMANLAAVLQDLPVDERRRVAVVFVSTDPEHDTPERVESWLARFDADFVGLVGSRSDVASVETALGLVPATTGADPLVIGHAAQVIVFAPDGQSREDYPFGTRQAEWSDVLRRLLTVRGPARAIGQTASASRDTTAATVGRGPLETSHARGGRLAAPGGGA